jgi:hypothetical protein
MSVQVRENAMGQDLVRGRGWWRLDISFKVVIGGFYGRKRGTEI